ncbi:MAG: prepilin-type N-terminal cleavage/methylation domain-containing protein, partial [Elusimicrobiota bacterium]
MKKGFTLIELMIVVAILGILAAVAIPKMAGLISRSQEGATKGNLGAVRSSLSIYYADNGGIYPNGPAGDDTTIVQDSIVIGLFALAATLILQDRIFATTEVGAVVIGFALQDTLG